MGQLQPLIPVRVFPHLLAQIDNGKFEDECRLLLGTNSYELFTLDKACLQLPSTAPAPITNNTPSGA